MKRDILLFVGIIVGVALITMIPVVIFVIPESNARDQLNRECNAAGGTYVRIYDKQYKCLEVQVIDL